MKGRLTFYGILQVPFSSQKNKGIEGWSLVTTFNLTAKLFVNICFACGGMAAVPQGAFAARKVRQNMYNRQENCGENFEKTFLKNSKGKEAAIEQLPYKYSSKLMNSIWGLYNRYSVHNLKNNQDGSANLLSVSMIGSPMPQN